MSPENILIVADSEHDANMLYAVGVFAPDPFVYLRLQGRSYVLAGDLELDRLREHACHCTAVSLSRLRASLVKEGVENPQLCHLISAFLRRKRIKKLRVSENFPLELARRLERCKLKIKPARGGLFPERQLKTANEVKKISAALMMAEVGLAEGMQALKTAKIGPGGKLIYRNAPLTSEKLRAIVNVAVLQAGGVASHTIVAGGRQGCEPHEEGSGVLKANQPIVFDIFPRSQKTGYFGDITRTVVKGRANEALRALYHTVERGQALAFRHLRHGAICLEIHQKVQEYFKCAGYATSMKKGRPEGFFHGTGHGVGLEIHEAPRMNSTSNDVLQAGHVVTVEPGLYYPHLGGVRLEDMVLITGNGPRNLTKFEKVLEID